MTRGPRTKRRNVRAHRARRDARGASIFRPEHDRSARRHGEPRRGPNRIAAGGCLRVLVRFPSRPHGISQVRATSRIPSLPVDIGALAPPLPPERKEPENSPPPSASAGEPVYTVLMPPLSFDANSPEPPPDPAPETILLVREVRLRPSVEFRGHVNPAPATGRCASLLAPAAPQAPAPSDDRPPASQPGLLDRVRNFFRRLTGTRSPCAGAGCRQLRNFVIIRDNKFH